MENLNDLIKKILSEIESLKMKSEENDSIGDWIPKKRAKKFLDYGDTAFASLIKSGELQISKIGRRVFVSRASLAAFLNKNQASM